MCGVISPSVCYAVAHSIPRDRPFDTLEPSSMSRNAIRLASETDIPVLLDMMADFNRLEEIEWARDSGEPALRKLLSDRGLGVVGVLDGPATPLGYFVLTWGFDLEWNGRDAYITELYLVPSARGQRLAPPFLACIEAMAREHGAQAIHLMVRPGNRSACKLYEGAGYESPPRVFLSKDLR
jgi:ribosomal protein S18 acetylase RimI-like enzyme